VAGGQVADCNILKALRLEYTSLVLQSLLAPVACGLKKKFSVACKIKYPVFVTVERLLMMIRKDICTTGKQEWKEC